MTCVIDGHAQKSVTTPAALQDLLGLGQDLLRLMVQEGMNCVWHYKNWHVRGRHPGVTQDIPVNQPAPEDNVDVLELLIRPEHLLEVWNAELDLTQICLAHPSHL